MRFGFKVSGCFGDVLYSTPVLKYLSKCHGDKLDIETNYPDVFKNNPCVGIIYNPEKGEIMPHDQIFYECNGHNFGDIQKQIRKMHLTDYWSTNLGFVLSPKENELLKMLAEHLNDLLPREAALKKIWGSDTYFNGRSMDVYIAKLRKYLKDDEKIEIVNIHGNGFRLVVQGTPGS